MYNNKYSDQLLPLITPEMLSRYPDQTCEILNKLIRLTQQSSGATVVEGGTGNLEDIIQTTTSYDDGGVNVVTAYLSDGTTQDFQIRNGHKGSQGEDGESATIAVGTTSTLPAGSSATVVNSGTSSAAVFDFGIPKGDTGAAGQDGADGFSPIANVSKVGDTATITITDKDGTTTASVTDGSDGTAATIAAGTTTTLPAGSSATVTNSGTSSAAVFDFGIPKGDTGAAGQDGADGFSPIATVSKVGDTATITITDENGTTTASVMDGSDGAPGAAATISAGTTTTLPAGSSATVTNSGTSSAAVFDFGIPKGDTGAAGPANTLSIGTVQSGVTADATITGTSPNQTLNLTLPQGSPGTSATVAVGTTTTLPAGSSATVTNTGTSSAAVFDFGIPQGIDGADGPKGDPGKGCPVGSILPFSGSTLPDGYLECNGAAVSRTTYSELFSVIGTTYGAGDGSTTFNLPNLKGKVPVGQDTGDTSFDTLGETGGSKTVNLAHSHTVNSHSHPLSDAGGACLRNYSDVTYVGRNSTAGNMPGATGTGYYWGWWHNADTVVANPNYPGISLYGNTDAASPGTNSKLSSTQSILQPYITVKYIIKYADMAATVADVLNASSASTTDVYSASYVNSLIPTVNNATLTIQKNGTNVQTFTANQATNATANITVPTSFSDLSGTVATSQIANNAVTSAKIDHSSINVEEIVYTQTFTSDQTSDQNVIIPMNFTTYKKITIEASYEPLDTTTGWRTSYARDNSNNRAICVQTGTEFNPNSAWIYRTQDQIVSHGVCSYCSCYIKIEILCTASGNYPTFEAKGMGGWEQTGTVYAQNFLGRISKEGSSIKDIVLEMAKPRSGGWVRVTGVKR